MTLRLFGRSGANPTGANVPCVQPISLHCVGHGDSPIHRRAFSFAPYRQVDDLCPKPCSVALSQVNRWKGVESGSPTFLRRKC